MTRKRRRLLFVAIGLLFLGSATALVLNAFQDSLVFFYSPSDLLAKPAAAGRAVRLGGLVEKGSVVKDADGVTVHFKVTDLKQALAIAYKGVLPDLFREGQGVVVEGRLLPDGSFQATEVLAKHDEKYMPPEVAKALKASGEWRPQDQPQPPAAQSTSSP
jgi:cytochrome c-type biogenesis protein CcmE